MLEHDTLLLASGCAESRSTMRAIFEEGFNLLEASSDRQTMLLLEQNHNCIASLILDATLSSGIDMQILTQIGNSATLRKVPVVVLTPPEQPEMVASALRMGAMEAMGGDTDSFVLQRRVQNIVDLHRHKWHLEELVEEQSSILKNSNDAMVGVLSSIVEYRSVESGQHILRIRGFTKILLQEIARSSSRYELVEQTIDMISSAAALHDIGKISIPDAILNKPGPLTGEEWQIMQSHAVTGCQIIENLSEIGDHEYLRYAYNICRYHHERWDGSGYPDGIAGDHIPICAQVVGLADAYDALTTKRVYKAAVSCEQAANMIIGGECGTFSPLILECFKHVTGCFAELARCYADGRSPNTEDFDTRLPGPAQMEELDALQALRSKYQMLLHYVDAAVVEVDVDQGVYHVVYNPDPNLELLNNNSSLEEFVRSIIDQTALPAEKEKLRTFVAEEIPRFLREGLMRLHYRMPVYAAGVPHWYDLTILRQSLADRNARKIIAIWQEEGNDRIRTLPAEELPENLCLCINDRWLTLKNSGRQIAGLLNYTREELGELFHDRLMELILPEDREMVRRQTAAQLVQGRRVELEYRLRHKNGSTVWVLHRCRLETDAAGEEQFWGILVDITATKRKQEQLQKQLQRQQIILSQTENVLYEWDVATDKLTFSDSWEQIFGYPPAEGNLLALLSAGSHFYPEDVGVVLESMAAMQSGNDYQVMEVRIVKADGRYLWCRFRSTGLRNEKGEIVKIVGIIINVDEEKRSAQALQERAERDTLTKLLNKHAARQQVESYLAGSSANLHCALFIIDLDDFKYINDRYGHMFGDSVLFQAAKEIRRLFRAQDIVARIGGDEFMVLMRGVTDRKLVENRCVQLLDAFHNVMQSQLRGRYLSCSVGVALFPQHGSSYSELFQRADQALYYAKDRGKSSYAIFDNGDAFYFNRRKLETAINERIESDDRSGLAGGNTVHYVFRHLYESQDLDATIQELLTLVGRQMNGSRAYIFENSEDNRFCSNTFEWCNEDILPEIGNLQNISYTEDIPNLTGMFDEQGLVYCPDIVQLPEDLYHILERRGVKSILLCAIRDNGVMRGFIGLDECRVNHYWTKEQTDLFRVFGETLSVFLLKKRAQDKNIRLRKEK